MDDGGYPSELLGFLRGRLPPPEHVLRGLRALSAHFRVSWTPATKPRGKKKGRPALWWLHEVRPNAGPIDRVRREVGARKRAQMERWAVAAKQDREAEMWQREEQAAGYYEVGSYAEDYFGTPTMVDELRRGQELFRQTMRQLAVEANRDTQAIEEIVLEEKDNPEFAAWIRDVATDFYPAVAGRRQVGYEPPAPTGVVSNG